jgi:hypothetical protein
MDEITFSVLVPSKSLLAWYGLLFLQKKSAGILRNTPDNVQIIVILLKSKYYNSISSAIFNAWSNMN